MMRVLVMGPSGAGKSYVSSTLRREGINAFDTDEIKDLYGWYKNGKKITITSEEMDKDFLENHEFLWDRNILENFLHQHEDVYLFGSSGNMFEMLGLFDKVFFLQVHPELQKERLTHESRQNPMGQTEFQRQNAVEWGLYLEKLAKEHTIPFIDATLHPKEIFEIIKKAIGGA